jgi:hypothetical protein
MAAYNYTYNTVGDNNFTVLGPTLGITSKVFKKAVTVGLVSSYNQTTSSVTTQPKTEILNLRLNTTYTFYKKHNITLSLNSQTRSVETKASTNILIGNLAYNFNF